MLCATAAVFARKVCIQTWSTEAAGLSGRPSVATRGIQTCWQFTMVQRPLAGGPSMGGTQGLLHLLCKAIVYL